MTVAVIGGGIAGLAAALRLRDRLGPAADITIFESQPVVGGKLHTSGPVGDPVGGPADTADEALVGAGVERGAESFRVHDPAGGESAAMGLVRRVGLVDELLRPAPVPAGLWWAGAPRPIPAGTLLGVPADPATVADLADVAPGRDQDQGRPVLATGADVTVGQLVRQRFGDQLVDRLVDPLLGGVYAGRADHLSLAATMPGLAAACTTSHTLAGAVRATLAASRRSGGGPALASVRGGLSRLAAAVATASAARLRLGLPVRALARAGDRWRLTIGSTRDPAQVEVDGVVLALPARPAAKLLAGVTPEPAELIGSLDYASVALVTLALPATVELPPWSGFLVPATEGTAVKAVTFVTRKWPQLAGEPRPAGAGDRGRVLVRASIGRYQESAPLRLADHALVAQVHAELTRMLGGLPPPLASHVQRWGGALPQYPVGHLARVAAARAALPATLRLAGAGYDGVGIAACVGSGEAAGEQLAAALSQSVV